MELELSREYIQYKRKNVKKKLNKQTNNQPNQHQQFLIKTWFFNSKTLKLFVQNIFFISN